MESPETSPYWDEAMPARQLSRLLQDVRKALPGHDAADLTDAQLLARYVTDHEEAAFECLVRRHGPMVLGVCRRVLGNLDGAEDAFQATFLVLVRKAASLRARDLLAAWLYAVAFRIALKAKALSVRRRAKEKQVNDMPEVQTEQGPDACHDLLPLLDEAVNQLPEKYRVPVVLCELEGRPRREAAQRLGVPEGTLSSRLATARRMLAKRLARHGLPLAGGALVSVLAQSSAPASVPRSLVTVLVKAAGSHAAWQALAVGEGAVSARAITLAEGAVKSMLLTKLRAVSAVLLAVFAAASLGVYGYTRAVPEQAAIPPPGIPAAQQPLPPGTLAGAELHMVGVYGPKGLNGNNKRVDVEVRARATPVVLVLTSYFTVDWHLKLAQGARLKRVILGGYFEQTIDGVPRDVPVSRSFPEKGGPRLQLWAYVGNSPQYREMVRELNQITGLPVATFLGAYEGTSFLIDGTRGKEFAQSDVKPPAPRPELTPQEIRAAAAGSELHVIGIDEPKEAGKPIDIEVRQMAKPVTLALTSYYPVVWKVRIVPGAQVKLVVFGGWNPQELEGVPPSTPVANLCHSRSHFHVRDMSHEVPDIWVNRRDAVHYRRAVERLNALTRLPLATYQSEYSGSRFMIDGIHGREFRQKEIRRRLPWKTLEPEALRAAAAGCELHVVGFRESSPERDRPVDVELRPTAKPVVLVLAGPRAVLWNLKLAEKARLGAVVLAKDRDQEIDGLPAAVPVVEIPRDHRLVLLTATAETIAHREMIRNLNTLTGLAVTTFQVKDTALTVDGVQGNIVADTELKPRAHGDKELTAEEIRAAATGGELHYLGVSRAPGPDESDDVVVEVRPTAKPAVLVLSSSLSTIWKLKLVANAQVKLVILGGDFPHEIDRLPAGVPVANLSGSAFPVGKAARHTADFGPYPWNSFECRRVVEKLNTMTGLPLATFQSENRDKSLVIDGLRGRHFSQKEIKPLPPAPRTLKPKELLAAAKGAELHVVGIAGPEHIRQQPVEVSVTPTARPIVLVLASYHNAVWNLKVADKADVRAIILGGYFEQEIVGVPATAPLVRRTAFPPSDKPGNWFYAYQSNSPEFWSMAANLKKMTGLSVTSF
jgi:RNA polymerase sigma factor (sigma-70 family)